jgi:hypothetical protein
MKTHIFDVEDAKKYGVECAVILYNLRFWLDKNRANKTNIKKGRVWTYNSTSAFTELFPYLTTKQIYSRLKKLEDAGVIETGNFNENQWDRTKWYTVCESRYYVTEKPISQNGKTHIPDQELPFDQTGTSILPNGKIIYTDIKPYNKPYNKPDIGRAFKKPDFHEVVDYFEEIGGSEPERFYDHFESNGWKVGGKTKMKDWKAAARNWKRNESTFNNKRKSYGNKTDLKAIERETRELFA